MTTTAHRPRSFMSRHKAWVVVLALLGLLLCAVIGVAAYLNHRISSIPRLDVDLNQGMDYQRPSRGAAGAVNILLAGVDAGEESDLVRDLEAGDWKPGSHRSDAILVLHLDADRRNAYVISVPRDTWVRIDGYGMNKVNAALSLGGPELFVQTMEEFTGLRMDHLALVDWKGFRSLTDALGGVEIRTPDGAEQLDGAEALAYVRERKGLPRGDLDRIQRQQNVLRALSSKTVSGGTLTNPVKLSRVLTAVTENVAVDQTLTTGEMRGLALSLRNLRASDLTQVTVPVKSLGMIEGQSVVLVDKPRTKALFAAVRDDDLEEHLARNDVDTLPDPGSVR